MTFVDTSALYAAADRDDRHHAEAASSLIKACSRGEALVTHSFVVVETVALIHRRLGHAVARRFLTDLDLFRVVWVDELLYRRAVERFSGSGRSGPSLVDCVSFALMHDWKIRSYLGFDRHFEAEGFETYRGGKTG